MIYKHIIKQLISNQPSIGFPCGCSFSNRPREGAHGLQNPTFSNLLDFR
jgi:hypothetical protein